MKVLVLNSKCFWIQRVVDVALLWAAELAFVALSRACFMRGGLDFGVGFRFCCLIGAATAPPGSIS